VEAGVAARGHPLLLSLGGLCGKWSIFWMGVGHTVLAPAAGRGVDSRTYWLLSSLPMLWFLAEVLTMLTNKKRRALHDFIAGTVVARTNTAVEEALPGEGSDSDSGISRLSRRTQGWRSEG